jgi:hypothetical protein
LIGALRLQAKRNSIGVSPFPPSSFEPVEGAAKARLARA